MNACRGLLLVAVLAATVRAQVFDRPTVLPPTDIERLDSASAAQLEIAKRFLAERQWSEAVEAIRRVQEDEPARLVRVEQAGPAGFERYVTAGEYCQWRLAALATEAPEALAHYRRLIDPLAENWFREGAKNNDEGLLTRVVEQAFASSVGDDALLKLGDFALARGDYTAARAAWRRIAPDFRTSPPPQKPLPIDDYPDSNLDRAGILARLALVSTLEGSRQRANSEIALLARLYPNSIGHLAGRDGRYVDLARQLFDESANWPSKPESTDWPTLAGDPKRAKSARVPIDFDLQPLWSYPLPRLSADGEAIGAGRLRVAEDAKSLLSYFPSVVGQTVLVRFDTHGSSSLAALDLQTGNRLWQTEHHRGGPRLASDELAVESTIKLNDVHAEFTRHLGIARYTTTAMGHKVLARMGSPVTAPAGRRAALALTKEQGFLTGFDLATQGRPLEGLPIYPPTNQWAFEGTPLIDGGAIYVAMRHAEGARAQIYLTAFELQTTPGDSPDDRGQNTLPTGRLKWQTPICSSATLGGGEIDQITHLLVTRDGGRLYLNTSAGAVAAVRADDGQLLWLVKYPRAAAQTGDPDQRQQHLFRDLTPCLAWKDILIVAPADCDRVFALEAATGKLSWTLPTAAADDAVHLLGVADETLVVSGDSLYWIDPHEGRLLTQFPPGRLGGDEIAAPSPRGHGRGLISSNLIAGNHVWWPTRESILVFDARPAATNFGWQPRLIRELPLAVPHVTGGNLVITDDILLIAGGDKLSALRIVKRPGGR